MRRISVLMCFVLIMGASQAALFQHLDASRPGTVVVSAVPNPVDPNFTVKAVTQWLDLSGKGNNAVSDTGLVYYPSTRSLTMSGSPALDFGLGYTRMKALNAATFLNQTAGSGFAVLMAIQYDDLSLGTNEKDALGTGTTVTTFGIRGRNDGQFQGYLVNGANSAGKTVNGRTVIVGFTYDVTTGARTVWDSMSGTYGAVSTIAAPLNRDFGSALPLYLGATTNATKFLAGLIGEVKIYDALPNAVDLAYQQSALVRKWVTKRTVSPIDGGQANSGSVTLNWLNLLPETQGQDVYVDVYFGTEPNIPQMTQVVTDGKNTESVAISVPTAGTYYWVVNTNFGYAAGNSDPNLIRGPYYSFTAVNDPAPSAVNAGADYITWTGQPVTINAAVTDSGQTPVTVTFTSSDPNLTFAVSGTTVQTVVIAGGGGTTSAEATHAAIAAPTPATVTVTAKDAANPSYEVSDGMTIRVYGNPCQAQRLGVDPMLDPVPDRSADINNDCNHTLLDLAQLAEKWLSDYTATAPYPIPAP